MHAPLEAALETVALRLHAAGVPFLLGGSALLDALGLEVEVGDVDLMLRPEDRARFEAACAEWLVAVTTEPGEALTSAWKATLDVGGKEVEGLGGLGITGGPAAPFLAAGARRYGAAEVPLCDPAVWVDLYRVYKPEKAALLAAHLAGGARVAAVCRAAEHALGKRVVEGIRLVVGVGVEGDAHAGRTVQHRSRVARDPSRPNLRQVHLIHGELHDELRSRGFDVGPGVMGENVTTRGVDLLALPAGTRLRLGDEAAVEVTGLRNPCAQLDDHQPGLMAAVLDRAPDGALNRRTGIMAVVLAGGDVRPGDPIAVELPPPPHEPLRPV
jgi:hypothetical protein